MDSGVDIVHVTDTSDSHCPDRSLSDINSILEFAKLAPSDFKPYVQCMFFSEQLDNDNIKILELDEQVLETLQAGKQITIRGDPSDGAVLVTDSATYDLKEAETSNSMLLMPQMTFGPDLPDTGEQQIGVRKVISIAHNYYELRAVKPRLKKLRTLLEMNPYRGRECEGDELDTGKSLHSVNFKIVFKPVIKR